MSVETLGTHHERAQVADHHTQTVRVRILVAVDDQGRWAATGYHSYNDQAVEECLFIDDLGEHLAYHWVEADIPIPTARTIEGRLVGGFK